MESTRQTPLSHKRLRPTVLGLIVMLLATLHGLRTPAHAWEPTTHAGLTEQAALQAGLDTILRKQFDLKMGQQTLLYATELGSIAKSLQNADPMEGYTPNKDGSLSALQWLVAGAALADQFYPQNHFFVPRFLVAQGGKGLSARTLSKMTAVDRMRIRLAPGKQPAKGKPALQWLVDKDNPHSLEKFQTHLRRAAQSEKPQQQRNASLAQALFSAGAILHILQDMGSPSHVRGDLAAHFGQIGNDPRDLASRYEHLAAITYGRLGLPSSNQSAAAHQTLADFFSNSSQTGLGDVTAKNYFSEYTVPRPQRPHKEIIEKLEAKLQASLGFAVVIDLQAARTRSGATLRNPQGVCVAGYKIIHRKLVWFVDDSCALSQLKAILPNVVNHSAGLLSWLFRRGETAPRRSSRESP